MLNKIGVAVLLAMGSSATAYALCDSGEKLERAYCLLDSADTEIGTALAARPTELSTQRKEVSNLRANLEARCGARGTAVSLSWQPSLNPDREVDGTALGEARRLVNYSGAKTAAAGSNNGLINYNRASVQSDCALFEAAFNFYTGLKESDLSTHRYAGIGYGATNASINETSPRDWFAEANRISRGVLSTRGGASVDSNHLAMKVMFLYGHDNRFNYLGNGVNNCQLAILDALKPRQSSSMYLNGAMGKKYPSAWITQANSVQKSCNAETAGLNSAERDLCDEYSDYQADYYHVISSAYMACHGSIAQTKAGRVDKAVGKVMDSVCKKAIGDQCYAAAETLGVSYYKLFDSFDSKVKCLMHPDKMDSAEDRKSCAAQSPSISGMSHILEKAFLDYRGQLPNFPSVPALSDPKWNSWCMEHFQNEIHSPTAAATCATGDDARRAHAILDRWHFELQFRLMQHNMGRDLGNTACSSGTIDHFNTIKMCGAP